MGGCSRVRDSLGGIKTTPEGSRTLATGASPWNQDNENVRAPEGRRMVATNLPLLQHFCRPYRGFRTVVRRVPRAYARGYLPAPLRGEYRPA